MIALRPPKQMLPDPIEPRDLLQILTMFAGQAVADQRPGREGSVESCHNFELESQSVVPPASTGWGDLEASVASSVCTSA